MKRLTVYLNYVKPEGGKIKNTLSYMVKTERDIVQCLSLSEGNIKKYTLSYAK
jgi:hypothetical protein